MYRSLHDETRTLTGLAGVTTPYQIGVTGPDGPDAVQASAVSGNYFAVLGIKPFIGRLIGESDDGAHGASPFIVLSYRTWQRWYGGDQTVVGKTVAIAGRSFTIIGVTPATFRGTELASMPDLWAPMSMITSLGIGSLFSPMMDRSLFQTSQLPWIEPIGRIRAGTTRDAAAAELNQLFSRIPREPGPFAAKAPAPKNPISVMPIARSAAIRDRDSLVRFIQLMLGVVVLTLLLGCANVANLLLVRSSERAQELGVRAALGASQTRIVRQLFIESAMLAIGGAAVGLGVAVATIRALSVFTLPGSIALAQLPLSLDLRVLAFTACVAVATASDIRIASSRPRGTARSRQLPAQRPLFARRRRPSQRLVAVQVALALTLLVGATLFARSLRAGLTTDLGFDPRPLAAVSFDLRIHGYDKARMIEYYRTAEQRLGGQPGIQDVALASHVPLARAISLPFRAQDATTPEGAKNIPLVMNAVSKNYFHMMRLPLVQGRDFNIPESEGAAKVAIVNTAAARRYWGTASPIGRSLGWLSGRNHTRSSAS